MVKNTRKAAAKAAPRKSNKAALPAPTLRSIGNMVRAYATGEGKFRDSIIALGRANRHVTEAQWNALYAPAFKAALERHSVGGAMVMQGRIKSLFLCASRDLLTTTMSTGLTTAGDAERRKALVKAKVLGATTTAKSKGARKGANARKEERARKAANGNQSGPIDFSKVKAGMTADPATVRAAATIFTGSPALASKVAFLRSNPDAWGQLTKAIGTIADEYGYSNGRTNAAK